MEIYPIISEADYHRALSQFEKFFDAPSGSKESREAELLALIIDDYEQKHHRIDSPDPVSAIKIRMDERGFKQKDLVGIIGSKSSVSEILNRKKKLTVRMIRKLSHLLDLPAEILIKDYPVKAGKSRRKNISNIA